MFKFAIDYLVKQRLYASDLGKDEQDNDRKKAEKTTSSHTLIDHQFSSEIENKTVLHETLTISFI